MRFRKGNIWLWLTLTTAAFLVPCVAATESENESAQLMAQAVDCFGKQDYENAERLYQQILDFRPDSAEALDAQVSLIDVALQEGDFTKAQAQCKRLLSRFSDHPRTPERINYVAFRYEQCGQTAPARDLRRYVSVTWPLTADGAWALREELRLDIVLQDGEAYAAGLARAQGAMMQNEKVAEMIMLTGWYCCEQKLYDKAEALHQMVLAAWPAASVALDAQVSLVDTALFQGDFTKAQKYYEQLLSRFSDHPRTAERINYLAYRYKKCRQTAPSRDLYRYVSTTWPLTAEGAGALRNELRLDVVLQDEEAYAAALARAQGAMAQNEKVARAIMLTGRYCCERKHYDKAEALYQMVLAAWPDSSSALDAQVYLVDAALVQRDFTKAQKYYEQLLSRFGDHPQTAAEVNYLARRYEKYGMAAEGREMYRYVISTWADSSAALDAQVRLVRWMISVADWAGAEQGVNHLLGGTFAADEPWAYSLNVVADRYLRNDRYSQALALYEAIIAKCPPGDQTDRARYGRILTFIEQGDAAAAEAATEQYIAAYPQDPAGALAKLAVAHEKAKRKKDACDTYLRLRNTYPDHPEALWANVRVALLSLGLAKEMPVSVAQEAIDRLLQSEEQMADKMADKKNPDETLQAVADTALKRQLFVPAGELYQLILRQWPDTPEGINAQTGLITSAMHQMDFTLVEQQYQQLLNRFGDHPRIADKVNEVARLYERFKMSTKSRDLYRYVSDTWPASDGAAKALKEELRLDIFLRDRAAYDTALAKAQGPMAENKGTAQAVMGAADYCNKKKYYDYAKELYQVVIDAWPQSEYVCPARANLIRRMIGEGDLDGAAGAVENLQSTFAQDAHLAEALRSIAGEYRLKARHDLALALYDTIIAQPDISSKTLTNTYRSRLMACMEMGDAAAMAATADRFRSAYPDKDQSLNIAQVAESAWKKGLAEAAVGLSNDILAHNPADEQAALLVRRLIILGAFMDGDTAQAESLITALINDYAGSKYLPGALKVLGDAYRSTVDKSRALQLYQLAATMAPTSKSGKKARKAWLKLSVELGATEEALAEAEALLADDVTGGGAVEQIYRLATACESQGQFAQAETLYRQVIAAQEMGSQRIHAQAHLAALLHYQGHTEEATTLLNSLVESFYNYPDFPKTLFMVAERSYMSYQKLQDQESMRSEAQKCLDKATLIWDVYVNQLPESRISPEAMMFLAGCYRDKQQWAVAAEYYQKAAQRSEFRDASSSLSMAGACYEQLSREGDPQAEDKARQVYQDLVNRFPDCAGARIASRWLKIHEDPSSMAPLDDPLSAAPK